MNFYVIKKSLQTLKGEMENSSVDATFFSSYVADGSGNHQNNQSSLSHNLTNLRSLLLLPTADFVVWRNVSLTYYNTPCTRIHF
jgi:hypothetical protein